MQNTKNVHLCSVCLYTIGLLEFLFSFIIKMDLLIRDPLVYFSNTPHIFDIMLCHLSVEDMLNLCSVNSYYYKSTTESSTFLKRVKLKVTKNLLESNFDIIEKSERNYRNVELNLNNRFYQRIFGVLTKFRDIRFLELKNCLLTTEEFKIILEGLQSLEELILDDLTFEDINFDEIQNLSVLRKLKNLQVKAIPEILIHPLLVKCPRLRRLSVMQLSRKAPVDEALKLLSNDTRFTLEQFEISDFGYYNFDQHKFGLLSFLNKSFNTLKILEFDVWIGLKALKLVFEMPNLEKLRLFELSHADREIDWKNVSLPRNSGIKYLILQDTSCNMNISTTLFKAVPNVRAIETYALCYEDLQEISKNCSELVELNTYFLDINETHSTIFRENLFKNLKRCNVAASDDLKQQILKRNDTELSHFEKLLLVN